MPSTRKIFLDGVTDVSCLKNFHQTQCELIFRITLAWWELTLLMLNIASVTYSMIIHASSQGMVSSGEVILKLSSFPQKYSASFHWNNEKARLWSVVGVQTKFTEPKIVSWSLKSCLDPEYFSGPMFPGPGHSFLVPEIVDWIHPYTFIPMLFWNKLSRY